MRFIIFFIINFFIFEKSIALNIEIPEIYSKKLSVLVVDDSSNNIVYAYNSSVPRVVASNVKLFTTILGLKQLKSDFHWHTQLWYSGIVKDGILNGDLYIKGGGDPTLDDKALYQIFSSLKRANIKQIIGNIIFDESIFNTKPTYSMLENRQYDADTVLPSGLMINGNLVKFKFLIKNNQIDLENNLYQYKVVNNLSVDPNLNECQDLLRSIKIILDNKTVYLKGSVAKACDNKIFAINLLPELTYNKMIINKILADFNISFFGNYLSGVTPTSAFLINDYSSDSLSKLLITMNKFSVNLIAETILLTLGVNPNNQIKNDPYLAGSEIFNKFLIDKHLTNPQFKLENAAGLSRSEKFTAQNIVDLLYMVSHSTMQASFEATLPTPGLDGTLKKSFLSFKEVLFAKTGSLNDTKTYSGYFYSKNGKKYIISILFNDIDNKNKSEIANTNTWINNLLIQLNQ